ncbi:hypothetical protein VJI95_08050 [Parvimonas sp. C2]|nr:hypothetical protein [Parvimonas sp. C2]MEB3073683.1 hypothetical protein [Parvimonas sp. C2]
MYKNPMDITGTGLAVAGAVVTAGAASGHAGYTCGKAAKGR